MVAAAPLPPAPSSPLPPAISINTQEARLAATAAAAATPDAAAAATPPSSPLEKLVLPARGVPDGCGLEILSAMSPSIPLPSPHELLNLKKGRGGPLLPKLNSPHPPPPLRKSNHRSDQIHKSGILRYQFNKRPESFCSMQLEAGFKKTIFFSGFKDSSKKSARKHKSIYLLRFVEQKNEGRKPDKNASLTRLEFMHRNLD